MSATAAPFGLRPIYHQTGYDRATRRHIAGGYATAMFKGQPVAMNTAGQIIAATGAADFKGVLAGVEFIDASGKPNYQPNWPAGQTIAAGTTAWAWVWEDPDTIFEVQGSGPIPLSALGDQADLVNIGAGNAGQGVSTAALGAPVGAGNQGMFRIFGVSLFQDNDWGDPFTLVHVKIARDHFIANKTAI